MVVPIIREEKPRKNNSQGKLYKKIDSYNSNGAMSQKFRHVCSLSYIFSRVGLTKPFRSIRVVWIAS